MIRPSTLDYAGRLVGHLAFHEPLRADQCPLSGRTYPEAAVDRHAHGIDSCPGCSAHVQCDHLPDGQVRIPPHPRPRTVTLRAVDR